MSKLPPAARNILLIFAIPLIMAVSHDVYINYFSDSQKIGEIKRLQVDPNEFMMSDLGWVWREYSADTMQMARDMTDEAYWKENIDPILQQPTILVATIPLIASIIALIITFILGIWPFSRFGRQRRADKAGYGVYKNAKGSKKITYSKK